MSSIKYRTIESFGAPGKPYSIQESEYNQYKDKRDSIQLILRVGMIWELQRTRWRMIDAEKGKPSKSEVFITDMNNSRSNEDGGVSDIPQINYYYDVLKRVRISLLQQMEFNKKAQNRDNARAYKEIENNTKIMDIQEKLEKEREEEEMNKLRREQEMCKSARLKSQQSMIDDMEKMRQNNDRMNKERKNMYNLIIEDAIKRSEQIKNEVSFIYISRKKRTNTEKTA